MFNWLQNTLFQPNRNQAIGAIFSLSMLWTGVGLGNVVGSDTQNFNPTTSGLDYVTVQSSKTLPPGFFNFGLFLNQSVNTLPFFNAVEQDRFNYSDSLLGADLNIGIGLLDRWDLGVSIPQIIWQSVENDGSSHGQFRSKGNTEVRINSKLRLFQGDQFGLAIVGSTNINRISNNPFVGTDAGPSYNGQLIADTNVANIDLALNLGHRWRRPGVPLEETPEIAPLRNQYIGSVAASYLIDSLHAKVIAEIFGSIPVEKTTDLSDRFSQSAELLLGLKHDVNAEFAVHGGAGTELIHGRGSPDWRLYGGINYSMGPTYSAADQPAVVEATKPPKFSQRDPFKGPPKAQEKIVIHDILFDFDSASLVVGGANRTLQKLVAYLNSGPGYTKLVIEGHTDSIGTIAYNQDLSRRRAETIRAWLVKRLQLQPGKVTALGRGELQPIANNGNYQGRQLNRRVEFIIYRDIGSKRR